MNSTRVMRTFTVATDDSLCRLISLAKDRIVYIAPGITEPVAEALGNRLNENNLSITVILDNDPEVYRLGLGTPEGLTKLKAHTDRNLIDLRCQPGIRIGVLVADDQTLIYTPIPQLIEAGSTSDAKPNALYLHGLVAAGLSKAAGATSDTRPSDAQVGTAALTPKDIAAIETDIERNPPQPFDLTQKARVYSSRLQYVEFSVQKYQLTRQTVQIPAYLMGLAGDMQGRWHNNLRILNMTDTGVEMELPGEGGRPEKVIVDQNYLDTKRKNIEKKFLIQVPGFGSVIFKDQQSEFEKDVDAFDALLQTYSKKLQEQIGKSLINLVLSVVAQLLPSVKANPPEQYTRYGNPSEKDLADMLQRDLEDAINLKTLLQEPKIKKIFKDIAYQSVKSDDFQKRLKEALTRAKVPPSKIDDIFRESDAALEKGGRLF